MNSCIWTPLSRTKSHYNWTESSTIQEVIWRVISKSDEGAAQGCFEISSTIVRYEVQLLINCSTRKSRKIRPASLSHAFISFTGFSPNEKHPLSLCGGERRGPTVNVIQLAYTEFDKSWAMLIVSRQKS